MIFDKKANFARLSPDSDNNDKEAYAVYIAGAPINIQPASPELIAISEGALGQTYKAFTTVSGVQIGDRITVSGVNDHYIVRGVDDWNWGMLPHIELVLFKGDK